MNDYIIFTDSGCDMPSELLEQWQVRSLPLSFRFSGDGREYYNNGISIGEFYRRMRDGEVAKTSAVNPEEFMRAFEGAIAEGKGVLYIGFSSALSTTYNSAKCAIERLRERYPKARMRALDTLCASAGEGLLLRLAVKRRDENFSLDELYNYLEKMKGKISHWFTVDDLVYLKRGGRVNAVTALIGNSFGIKPVLHVDDGGRLVGVTKVRGRRSSIAALKDRYSALAENPREGTVFISHADCPSDAELLADMIYDGFGVRAELITDVGTVIGAHSGPGTLALFFVGRER